METNTTSDIIQLIDNAPYSLNKIVEDFLEVERNFNSGVLIIQSKEETILSESKSSIDLLNKQASEAKQRSESILTSLKNDYDGKVAKLDNDWKEGTYVRPIVSKLINKWIEKGEIYEILRWVALGIGVILLFFVNWLVGILTGVGGYLLLNLGVKAFSNRITRANFLLAKGTNGFSETDRISLKTISSDIRQALDAESNEVKINNEALKKALENEYIGKNQAELIDREKVLRSIEENKQLQISKNNQKIENFENNKNIMMSELRIQTVELIRTYNINLNSIINLLNQIPETFDSIGKLWNSDDMLKGKDLVSANFRIGNNRIKIEIEGEEHFIDAPRLISFLNKSNLALNCHNQNETNTAISVSHNIISRALLSLPASKTKITFIDPLGLGENAAQFSALERGITGGMVYTQPSDIESQLLALTRAIENVIQKYLQGNIESIGKYNEQNNEVPEPYRLLVIYNFPHGFSDTTANKLLNILKSGPKAGVHTILVTDKNAKLPYGIDWKAFEGVNIKDISLTNTNSKNREFEFDTNLPYNEIVNYINKELPNSSSIKVAFKLPPQTDWWREKAHEKFSVPIGRHALEEQSFALNNENANQALLIGKPGSGKSNLLHTIISNSLWKYSPDQLEIYLIDFKGGVEFTIYADKEIPHIKAIAIESDREFGESILAKIRDKVLEREIICRSTGVDSIYTYNEKFKDKNLMDKMMPRVLLIVDEFHLFFSEEDSLSERIHEMFSTIVQKGRAFGVNTLFSSQTLSIKSIKAVIKGLIDVRIALMCSEDDAPKILDEKNSAAKDLVRPGEGIYNNMGGKTEGNRKFQAFFVEKDYLSKAIESIAAFSRANEYVDRGGKQIIFRGSEKAQLEKTGHRIKFISRSQSPKFIKLWLGEPIAIADDVTASIGKQGGSNLLICGSDEVIGLRVMCSSIISIASYYNPQLIKFYSFNFFNIDSELSTIPDDLFGVINHGFKNISNRDVRGTLQEIKDEVERRLSNNEKNNPNFYLTFFSFQRARAFRQDNYDNAETNSLLSYILKEGPDAGVFTLLQTDSMDNLFKNMDYNLITEFSHRVASQMNSDNSAKIMGNQQASKLGINRAIYYDDSNNKFIKFKPYEIPIFSHWASFFSNDYQAERPNLS